MGIVVLFIIVLVGGIFFIRNLSVEKDDVLRRSSSSSEKQQESVVNNSGEDGDKSFNEGHEEDYQEKDSEPQYRKSVEIPMESERATLPDCGNVLYTEPYVDPAKIREIAPLGSINPPGHTIPTNHVYSHLNIQRESTQTVPLYLPADAWITHISIGKGFTQDPEDDTIYFAVCKDVIGYFNHIKKLSPEIQKIVDSYKCADGNYGGGGCMIQVLTPLKKGTYLGEVGRLQGNFDLGTFDLRTEHNFVNKERYAERTLHIQCPFDYYTPELKKKYYDLLQNKGNCGKINYDIPGTLQGNWFYGDSKEYYGGDWVKHAFFGYDNVKPERAVLALGGVIVSENGLRWKFSPANSGTVNRRFEDVKNDGNIYCYDKNNEEQFNINPSGRVLVKLESERQVKLEHQSGGCGSGMSFTDKAKMYER